VLTAHRIVLISISTFCLNNRSSVQLLFQKVNFFFDNIPILQSKLTKSYFWQLKRGLWVILSSLLLGPIYS